MVRIPFTALTGTLLVWTAVGCAHFAEMEAIEHFTSALESSDLDKLKAVGSETFDEKALRRKDSVDALKILYQHPGEKVTIIKVNDVSPDEKKVDVTSKKTKRNMQYRLVRDGKSGRWLVDDIVMKQNKKDVAASKTITEQMDLLLAVQDFLVAWHGGKRDDVQKVTTRSFGQLLADLPPAHLERLTKKVAGERLRSDEFRPEATIDGNDAMVKLQRAKCVLLLTMKKTKGGWQVYDVAVQSHKDKQHLASARKTASAIRTVVNFLKAYKDDDKQAIEKVSAKKFYESCLSVADLKTIPLPTPDVLGDNDIVQTHEKGGEYALKRGSETVKIALTCLTPDSENTATKFLVEDVTIFGAKQEMRLSALYTAQAKLRLFSNALIKGNLAYLKKNSTKDLNGKVWNLLGPISLAEIVPPEIEMTPPVVSNVTFHGALIRIDVTQGSRELTYMMRDWSGDVTVDDILMPVLDRPNSMKTTMQAVLPVRLLAAALREASAAPEQQDAQLAVLRGVTSRDFNSKVWSQLNQIPEQAYSVLPHLDMVLTAITDTPEGQIVLFGDDRFGAKIELVREKDTLLINKISLLRTSQSQTEPTELKTLLRAQLARHGRHSLAFDPMSTNPIKTDPLAADSSRISQTAADETGTEAADPPGATTQDDAASAEPPLLQRVPGRRSRSSALPDANLDR